MSDGTGQQDRVGKKRELIVADVRLKERAERVCHHPPALTTNTPCVREGTSMATTDSTPLRRCTKCDQDKATDRFKVRKDRPGGLGHWCRDCVNQYQRERHARASPLDNSEFETHFSQAERSWHDAEGFPNYRIGNDGSVWSCYRSAGAGRGKAPSDVWRRLSPDTGTEGYQRVSLYLRGVGSVRVFVHHLVLRVFVGPCPPGMECCHGDGNPSNNQLDNLRWGTPQDNWADRKRHGHGRAWSKLSSADVRAVRSLITDGMTATDVASMFGVSDTQIRNIIAGRQWKEVG